MADGEMKYENEKEEADFTMSGTTHVYNFTETYTVKPKVIIDQYTGNSKPSPVVELDKVTITGEDEATGHLTVIEQ